MPGTVLSRWREVSSLTREEGRRSIFLYLCRELVLKFFDGMNQGYLELTLPSGELWIFGRRDGEVRASIRIVNPDFFRKCVLFGDVGFGESFVDGDWESDQVTDVIRWMILNVQNNPAMSGSARSFLGVNLLKAASRLSHRFRPNSLRGSRENIRDHYDLSNDFFKMFLGPSMAYSAALFETPADSLERAQELKYDRLCRKLKLKESDHVLEIGCGWGGFSVHAARRYGCRVTGVTISREQLAYARKRVAAEGLQDRIDLRFEDYRQIKGSYDKIVSIEMLEAVGHDYLETYFARCHEVLKPSGLIGLQVITCPDNRYGELRHGVDWIQKHIFPGSLLPSIGALNRAVNRTGDMVLHHLEDMGTHYARTLQVWRENLNARRSSIQSLGFDELFLRKWNYYFSYCEAAFAMRNIAVLQMVYTRPNNRTL